MTRAIIVQKKSLRILIRAARRIIPTRERIQANQEIAQSLFLQQEWQTAKTACLYMSQPEEVDTKLLLADLLNYQKTAVFPKTGKKGLTLHKISSIKDFTLGPYGILEPKKSCKLISPENVNLFIVPGIAFDRNGYRLGWGKGYYDKLLKDTRATKIGLAYSSQVVAEVPHTSYDVPMTMVVTEKEVVICRR